MEPFDANNFIVTQATPINSWEQICNCEECTSNEKNKTAINFQKKLKSLADSFNADVISVSSSNTKRKKRRYNKKDKLIKKLQKKIATNEKQNKDRHISHDDDTLFCLSLVSDLKQISHDMKTDAKYEILQVLKKFKRSSTSVSGYTTNVSDTNLELGQSNSSSSDPIDLSSVHLHHINSNRQESPLGIAQLQHPNILHMIKTFAPRAPLCSTSTTAYLPTLP